VTEERPAQSMQSDSSSSPSQVVLRGQHDLVAPSSLVGRGLARAVRGEWREEKSIGFPEPAFGTVIVSPVGDRLAWNRCYPDRHEMGLWERRIGSWVLARRLRFPSSTQFPVSRSTPHDDWFGYPGCAAWSPCGRYLATGSACGSKRSPEYHCGEHRLLVFDTATGDCREVAFLHRSRVTMAAWSTSGEFLASVSSARAPILRLWRCHWQQGSLGRELISTELIGRWAGLPGMRITGDLEDAGVSREEVYELDARGLCSLGATGVAFSDDEKTLAVVMNMYDRRGLVVLLSVPELEDISRRALDLPNPRALTLRWAPRDGRLLVAGFGGVEVLDARLQSETVLLERGLERVQRRWGYPSCYSRAAWSGTGDYVCIGIAECTDRKHRKPDEPPDISWSGEMLVVAMADRRVFDTRTIAGGVHDVMWVPSRCAFRAATGSATVVEWRPPLSW